jgi:hypothetical protein
VRGLRLALWIVGYPVAIAIIARWVPVVRQRRLRWFVAHEAAVAAIVAGHALRGGRDGAQGVAVNGAWLVAAAVWYVVGGRRRPTTDAGMYTSDPPG